MRKLKLQVQISVDGFIAGPDGQMDWITWEAGNDFIDYVTELTDSSGTIVLGRKLAEGFIPYWTNITSNPDDPQYPFARKMADMPKTVFSKTLDKSPWENTAIAKGDLATEINKIKSEPGKDIMIYGGAGLVSSVIKAGLIDEFHLFVSPSAIGKGMTIFNALGNTLKLSLIKATPLASGIIILHYQPK